MDARKVIIVPHTHWDREWYLPFQRFRYKLVELIDELLDIMNQQDYKFMLDGQTVILEDYFEIRPERKDELLKRIRKGKIAVGPWYLLPDEWLVGEESLIRNLEYSHDLAARFNIPLMNIAYLPDQFGHSSVIPQLLSDLTNLNTAVLWRGVPPDIMTVPFTWKSHGSSKASIRGVYLPTGYGNVSMFPEDYNAFVEMVNEQIAELESYSPVPSYLLMNGSDHFRPQPFAKEHAERMAKEGFDISLGFLDEYAEHLEKSLDNAGYTPPEFAGELRSPARAPLLQDTYSARMWIKLWNQRVENILTREAEPMSTYLWLHLGYQYPTSFLETAWKWLLRNHPHDSICGCSVDKTHEEMKARFSWAESIGESIVLARMDSIQEKAIPSDTSSVIVFDSGGSSETPVYIEFSYPRTTKVRGIRAPNGEEYEVQPLESKDDIFLDTTVGLRMAKMGMKLLPGRKLMNFYINGVEYYDGDKPGLLELRFIADRHMIGEFDMEAFKKQATEMINTKRYNKVHLVAARPTQSVYASVIPLQPWAFTKLVPMDEVPELKHNNTLEVSQNEVRNKFYSISFNKDGTLTLVNKESDTIYQGFHTFEDFGDRGDEYTFGRLGPEKVKVKDVKRTILCSGPLVAEIRQTMTLEIFASIDDSREKRIGTAKIPVESVFRIYRDIPRIEVTTKLKNTAKDHRLRICFNLPFTSTTTKTATHFGYVDRDGNAERIPDAEELDRTKSSYPEKPSGIQPQKQFIRIDDEIGIDAVTIFNKGLPEVELVDEQRVAITLIRSVGWLSRSDYPERLMQAGPEQETPGAQEVGIDYEFHYGFMIHSRDTPIHVSSEHADVFSSKANVVSFENKDVPPDFLEPMIQIDNPSVRISSMRVRNDRVIVTLYNIENQVTESNVRLAERFTKISELKIDSTMKRESTIEGTKSKLTFNPREIKICELQ
ncbi:MAG: glycoside hydrolase family 38 C-terminal domain-containing protein [Candidatus Thorarchaeota archaeon]